MSRADWMVFIGGFITGVLGLSGWVFWVLRNHRDVRRGK